MPNESISFWSCFLILFIFLFLILQVRHDFKLNNYANFIGLYLIFFFIIRFTLFLGSTFFLILSRGTFFGIGRGDIVLVSAWRWHFGTQLIRLYWPGQRSEILFRLTGTFTRTIGVAIFVWIKYEIRYNYGPLKQPEVTPLILLHIHFEQ